MDNPFIKIIIVGNKQVGKTSFINKYCYNKYEECT